MMSRCRVINDGIDQDCSGADLASAGCGGCSSSTATRGPWLLGLLGLLVGVRRRD